MVFATHPKFQQQFSSHFVLEGITAPLQYFVIIMADRRNSLIITKPENTILTVPPKDLGDILSKELKRLVDNIDTFIFECDG